MRYRLRTLLIAISIASIVLALHASRLSATRQQVQTVHRIREMAADAIVQHEDFGGGSTGSTRFQRWLERCFGHDYLYPVNAFCLVSNSDPDQIIQETAHLPHLYLVKLPACQITDRSLEPLVQLHRLEWLELFATPVTDEGLKTVAKIKSLRSLDLRGTKVTDASIPSITSLPNLSRLVLRGETAITDSGRVRIRQVLPTCEIE